jgi:hypothetical protein
VRDLDLAVGQQAAVTGSHVDLAAVAAHLMDQRLEGTPAAQGRLDREAAGDHGGGKQLFGGKQALQGECGGGLGPIEQGQTLLGPQDEWLQTGKPQALATRKDAALVLDLPLAKQDTAHVGQGHEVAGGAHGPLLGHTRVDAGVDELDQPFEHLQPDSGIAAGEAVDFQEHHQPHGRIAHQGTDTGGMREDNRALQMFQLLIGDNGVGQEPETGVDPVNHPALAEDLPDGIDGGKDRRRAVVRKTQPDRLFCGLAQLLQRQRPGGDANFSCHGFPIKNLMNRKG